MGLASDLVSTPPRERGATANRYDYQTLWGLTLLLKQHNTSHDYAIIFEFHDDVALLDSATAPNTVKFFQIKTKDTKGDWSISSLVSRPKTKTDEGTVEKPSHLDKMFDGVDKFKTAVTSVSFVSNKPCSFKREDTFRFKDCSTADFNKIVTSIQTSYPSATRDQIGLLGYERSHLSLSDAITHTKGSLHAFIARHLKDVHFNPESIYTAIIDDCRLKANYTGSYTSLAEAISEKGLTRANVDEWLDGIRKHNRAPEWSEIAANLDYPFADAIAVRNQYLIYRAEVLNTSNRAIQRVRMAIVAQLPSMFASGKTSLVDMIESIFPTVEPTAMQYLAPYRQPKLRAMIIYEIFTNA